MQAAYNRTLVELTEDWTMQIASLGVSTGHVSKQEIRPLREIRPMHPGQSGLR